MYLKVDRVNGNGVRRSRGGIFRGVPAVSVVVNVGQRTSGPELIAQINVKVFAARLWRTSAGTLDGERGLRYAGSRGARTHRAARRCHLSKFIIQAHKSQPTTDSHQQLFFIFFSFIHCFYFFNLFLSLYFSY